jgi:hypothetical protein
MNTLVIKDCRRTYRQALSLIIVVMMVTSINFAYDIGDLYAERVEAEMHHLKASVLTAHILSQIPAISMNAENLKLAHAATVEKNRWKGPVLSKRKGVVHGPSGKETYYNLNMSIVVRNMHRLGYDYEYWVRDDGVKMLGDYVMIAANLNMRPRGTLVETSLGTGIVCDTGGFAKKNPTQIDIATTW